MMECHHNWLPQVLINHFINTHTFLNVLLLLLLSLQFEYPTLS